MSVCRHQKLISYRVAIRFIARLGDLPPRCENTGNKKARNNTKHSKP
jgi:hypothetical protein